MNNVALQQALLAALIEKRTFFHALIDGIAVKQKDNLGLAIALEKVLNGMEFDSKAIREYAMQFSDETVLQELKNLYQKFNG